MFRCASLGDVAALGAEAVLVGDVLDGDGDALGADVRVGAALGQDVLPAAVGGDEAALLGHLGPLVVGEAAGERGAFSEWRRQALQAGPAVDWTLTRASTGCGRRGAPPGCWGE